MRYYHSWDHLNAAALQASDARRAEEVGSNEVVQRVRHRGYVVSSLFASVAYLEAAINELLADCMDRPEGFANGISLDRHLDDPIADAIGDFWRESRKDYGLKLRAKFEKVLDCAKVSPIDRGGEQWYNLDRVLQLRNSLVHYVPGTQGFFPGEDEPPTQRIDKLFKDRPFGLNPIALNSEPFWPDRCLSFCCASWSLDVALDWVSSFCQQMKTPCVLIPHRSHVDEAVAGARAHIQDIRHVL